MEKMSKLVLGIVAVGALLAVVSVMPAAAKRLGLGYFDAVQLASRTKAQFDTARGEIGETTLCSNCAIPYSMCVATGTAAAQWKVTHSATIGCGTNN